MLSTFAKLQYHKFNYNFPFERSNLKESSGKFLHKTILIEDASIKLLSFNICNLKCIFLHSKIVISSYKLNCTVSSYLSVISPLPPLPVPPTRFVSQRQCNRFGAQHKFKFDKVISTLPLPLERRASFLRIEDNTIIRS